MLETDDFMPLPSLDTNNLIVDTDDENENEDEELSDNITMEVDDMENENFINTSSV